MDIQDLKKTNQFSTKVSNSFAGQKYELSSESYETTWGFKSTSGKNFKVSNNDMLSAFSDILKHWGQWTDAKLNINSVNPDATIYTFSKANFGDGAHKELAETQRRGFAHLINAIAYSALNDGLFDEAQWQSPLKKRDYEAALDLLRENSANSRSLTASSSGPEAHKTLGSPARVTGGENALYYGAPGTGKSHDVWQMIDKKLDGHFVTVFHPDMQNSDFAGTLKPGVADDGEVTYSFRPGPFARALASAWANPEKKTYLVIEELNRAVAAAVFGELFQLLDREPDGSSCYDVDFPSPEFESWFHKKSGLTMERLALPSNLWILATMNSADQGVYPLDTAFRRRWRQNYLPIDYKKAPAATVRYVSPDGEQTISWGKFVKALNEHLVNELGVNEDRLIGPRYLSEHDLSEEKLPGKLLIYLWDDLLRHDRDNSLFAASIRTYGDLHRKAENNDQIFSEGFLASLEKNSSAAEVAEVSEVAATQ